VLVLASGVNLTHGDHAFIDFPPYVSFAQPQYATNFVS
jgi:hypothetical protein